MTDAYYSYGGAQYQASVAPAPTTATASVPIKRPRADYSDVPGGPERVGYYPHDGGRGTEAFVATAVGAPYDRYVHSGPVSSFRAGESARTVLVEVPRHFIDDGRMMGVGNTNGPRVEYGGVRLEKPLPPDATSTLFVEGLPADCTRREVSHVFRPFPGFREVRLVNKESRHPGGDPWVLCFVDFSTASQAAVALDCLQGYVFDEHERASPVLRLQFSRSPGPKSGGGPRSRR